MSTSADFEEVIEATREAAENYLARGGATTLRARFIADDVGEDARTVGKAFVHLEQRGEVKSLNASTPRRWTIVDDGGEDDA